jgi:hypothetical protein
MTIWTAWKLCPRTVRAKAEVDFPDLAICDHLFAALNLDEASSL